MAKYKYEKFQIKAGRKSYILSQHEGDNWAGPVVEHFTKENATKLGIYSEDRKYLFEVAILNPQGTEYTVKTCKDGYPNGPTIVVVNDTMYIGQYYTKDGFNGIVYRFKQGERVRIQDYRHGILIDECLHDYVMYENVAMPIPFDCFYENSEIVERNKNTKSGKFTEFIAGDPASHQYILGASVDEQENIRLGQYKNNTFDGLVFDYSNENKTATFSFYDNGKQKKMFRLIYLPDVVGYAVAIKKEDLGYTDLVYCKKDKKYSMSIIDLNDKDVPITNGTTELPNKIDPNAEKPYGGEKKKHKPHKDEKGLTAMERLEKMIGLTNIKSEIAKLKAILAKNPDKAPILNMAFMGNPGTGKTEVARLFAEILYDEGILSTNKFVETDRSGLVAEYVGQTAIKTHNLVKSAVGGVLFIDEAYSLKPSDPKDFGGEAIDALIADMENYRGKMCFILAGYKQPLLDMIETNKGFKSRINRFFDFKDFTESELCEIAKLRLAHDGYKMSDTVLAETIKIIAKRKYADDFANAREVRNVLEKLYEYQAERTFDTNKKDMEITMADIDAFNSKDDPEKVDNLTAEEQLQKLIGLSGVKKEILKLKAFLAKNKDAIDKTNLHMCFYGNPGTGKTEVARLLANIFYDEGILPENKFIETDSSGLISAYAGQTAIKTHKLVKDSLGGILFIDEAYALMDGSGYGKEAINALITDMENYRGKFCVIMAGYKDPMEDMLSVNPGFKSRINRNIEFDDYSDKELLEIAKIMLKSKKYTITDDALNIIGKVLQYERKNKDFANARTVRNILESIYEIQALRTYKDGISDSWLIKPCDVEEYINDHNIVFVNKAEPKINFDIKLEDFTAIADNYDQEGFIFNTEFVEQASVNIKIEKEGKPAGEGSGFFISPKGIIATCAHVVAGADKINVIVNFKTTGNQFLTKDYSAELIALNKENDVALLGIVGSKMNFAYYPLAQKEAEFPKLMTEIVMGGYPFGGDRFETITITEGKVQSVNKDYYSDSNRVNLYVDLSGHPGSSGSGVVDKATGRCIGLFAGAAIGGQPGLKLTINFAVPTKYLWDLIEQVVNNNAHYSSKEAVELIEVLSENAVEQADKIAVSEDNSFVKSKDQFNRSLYENIHIVRGDITTFQGDAIVNAANRHLEPGAGVCGAVFDVAGYDKLLKACREIGGCDIGKAVLTKGFDLKAKYIIHAVGPRYDIDRNPERLLSSVYESSFDVAIRNGIKTIAFPSISTGIYKFPKELAVPIALKEMFKKAPIMDDIYVYCFDDSTYNSYISTFERLKQNAR